MGTLRTDFPVCPACGHSHRDAWEWDFGAGLEGDTEHECDICGYEFRCTRIVDVAYTTKPATNPVLSQGTPT